MQRAELPAGTVTFLFTDIEGSTRLLQELGDRYLSAQDRHAVIVRRAIADHDGVEVRTEGDAFFAAFRTPAQALSAAVEAQRALSAERWPHGRPLRVRVGLHTGEGVPGGDDYIGLDVNRAARIAAAGWGGQIVLSDATRSLVHRDLPDGVSIRSQGTHRLKDLVHPEDLHDVVIDGLLDEFPPLRTLEIPVNLPAEVTSFVGRGAEIARGVELLGRTRLLTLTGPGGTGKTRLAVRIAAEVAVDFPDGVAFVDLSPITDPALVISTIAAAVGIREEGWERPARQALEEHIARRRTLLVLDNFEQVLDAAADVSRLLELSARSKVVVTSRSPLHLRGEQELRVTPLPLPDLSTAVTMEDLSGSDAVALFAERATAVAPDLKLDDANVRQIAEICARLDGLPLAIELAASRAGLLSPAAMLSRMDRRLPVRDEGPRDLPARQRTLRATVAWSYDLLNDRERLLFRRLSVMVGGSTLEAAEAVCLAEVSDDVDTLECVSALVDGSLVGAVRTVSEEPRFDMLRIVRAFGLERLEAEDDRVEVERRHVSWFLRLAEDAAPEFRGPQVERWLWTLEVEHDNLRAALRRAIEEQDSDVALRLVASLFRFWHLAGHISEGIRWAREALSLPGAGRRTLTRARALATLGGLAYWRNDFELTRSAYEEALEIGTALEDPRAVAKGSYNLAFAYRLDRDASGARELLDRARAMFDGLGDERGVADCLWVLSLLARLEGDAESARVLGQEAVRVHRELGDLFGLIDSLNVLARAAYEMGELDVARASAMESLEVLGSAGYRTGIAIALDNLAAQENERGRPVRAVRIGGASEALREDAGAQAPPEFIDLPDPRAKARALLSPEQIAAAWEEGKAMNLEAILRYALEGS